VRGAERQRGDADVCRRVCEHVFVSDSGSAYARFQRALKTGNLTIIRSAAAELPMIKLDDALHVCVLLRDREPERYDAAAVRWIGRFCAEQPDVTLEEVDLACSAFEEMRMDPERGLTTLQSLVAWGNQRYRVATSGRPT
jgi:hypothetical protein